MAFLDQKDRILDIVLTDEGRRLFSQNQLNFKYYAFSDEGIIYSGSLSASQMQSSSFENYVHRDLSFEADQRKEDDLKSFLYTIPQTKKVLPELRMSVSVSSSVVLERKFYMDTVVLNNQSITTPTPPVDIIVRATVPRKTLKERIKAYVGTQRILSELVGFVSGKR